MTIWTIICRKVLTSNAIDNVQEKKLSIKPFYTLYN